MKTLRAWLIVLNILVFAFWVNYFCVGMCLELPRFPAVVNNLLQCFCSAQTPDTSQIFCRKRLGSISPAKKFAVSLSEYLYYCRDLRRGCTGWKKVKAFWLFKAQAFRAPGHVSQENVLKPVFLSENCWTKGKAHNLTCLEGSQASVDPL